MSEYVECLSTTVMSPFSLYLVALRNRVGLRQGKLAELLGYEQSYLSALELGTKGPTNQEFLFKLVSVLKLDETEQQLLANAVRESKQRFVLPKDVSPDTFRMCSELWEKVDQLQAPQVAAIRAIVAINTTAHDPTCSAKNGIKHREEAPM